MPVFQPQLNPLSGGGFIAPAVQDFSMARAIEGLGNAAIEGFKGYQQSEIEQGIDTAIAEYKTRFEAPDQMAVAGQEALTVDKLFDQTGISQKEMADLGTLNDKLQERLAKYKAAYEQGAMSATELDSRIKATTKEVISRTPGWGQELAKYAAYYSDLSGASDLISSQTAREKSAKAAADEQMKYAMKIMEKQPEILHAYQTGRLGFQQAYQEAAKREQKVVNWENTSKGISMLEAQGKLDKKVITENLAKPEVREAIDWQVASTDDILRNAIDSNAFVLEAKKTNPNIDPSVANKTGIQRVLREQKKHLSIAMTRADEAGAKFIQSKIDEIEQIGKIYEGIADGSIVRADAENRLAHMKAVLNLGTAPQEHKLQILNMMASATANLSGLFQTQLDKTNLANTALGVLNSASAALMSGDTSGLQTIDLSTKEGQTKAAMLFAIVDPEKNVGTPPEDTIKQNSTSISNSVKALTMMSKENPKKSYELVNNLADNIVKLTTQYKKPLNQLISTEAMTEVRGMLATHIASAVENTLLDYDEATNSLLVMNPNGTVNPEATKRAEKMFKSYAAASGYDINGVDTDTFGKMIEQMARGEYVEPKDSVWTREEIDLVGSLKAQGKSEAEITDALNKQFGTVKEPQAPVAPKEELTAGQEKFRASIKPQKSTPLSDYPRNENFYLKNFKKTEEKGGTYTLVDSKGREYIISNKSTYDAFLRKFKVRPENLPKWSGK